MGGGGLYWRVLGKVTGVLVVVCGKLGLGTDWGLLVLGVLDGLWGAEADVLTLDNVRTGHGLLAVSESVAVPE